MSNEKYSIERSPLYRMRNRRKLAVYLGLDQNYFKRDYQTIITYTDSLQQKPSGNGFRVINNPNQNLKNMQRAILRLLQRIELPTYLFSGKKGISYIDNAAFHQNANHVLTMDISAFYDSADYDDVYRMFTNRFMMEDDIARIMTRLVTYKHHIPTGAPTSQLIVFLTYEEMFNSINDIAGSYGCKFSLYVDDMTFSSSNPIRKEMRQEVVDVLNAYGFNAKWEKDHHYGSNDAKLITGVVIGLDNELKVRNRQRRKLLDQLSICRRTDDRNDIERLSGLLNSMRQIEPGVFPSVERYINYWVKKNSDKTC